MLTPENTALCLIDIQGKLAQLMYEKEQLFGNLQRLVKGSKLLGLPILWCEQNPDGLGPTIPEVAQLLPELTPFSKYSFSCCGDEPFRLALEVVRRKNILVAGIETHVCVYQTVRDLLAGDHEVEVIVDAVSSRTVANKEVGLRRMRDDGARLSSTEMVLFELQQNGQGERFKELLKIVK